MLESIKNIFSVKDIRKKLLFTLLKAALTIPTVLFTLSVKVLIIKVDAPGPKPS